MAVVAHPVRAPQGRGRATPLVLAAILATAAPGRARADEDTSPPGPGAMPAVADRPSDAHPSRARQALSAGLVAGVYTSFATWVYYAWYADIPRLPEFKIADDGAFGAETYAGGSDKLGHLWANLALTRGSYRLLRWGSWRPIPAALLSGGMAVAFFTAIEVKDGYYYEASPGDAIANVLGAGLAIAMETSPRLDALIDVRVEYWPSDEYRAIWRGEADPEIHKSNVAEDYSGQTYLLALHLGPLTEPHVGRWGRYVDVVVGYNSDNYRPAPALGDEARRQTLFLGLSLNAQGIVDDVLDGPGARRHARAFGHGMFEVFNVPFTSLPLATADRSAD